MPCSWRGHTLVCRLRVQPRASREGFAGPLGDRLRVRVQAPPVDGRANQAVVEFMARSCGVPRARVRLVSGEQGRNKLVEVERPARLPPALAACVGRGPQARPRV